MLFLLLKYNGVCLCPFPFFLMGVLRTVREDNASLSVGSGDILGDSSLYFSPSYPFLSSPMSFISSSSCRSSSSLSVSSLKSSSVSSSSSFYFSSSSSYSSFSFVSSISSSLIAGLTPYVRSLMPSSICMSLKTNHCIGIMRFWREYSIRILINPC